MPVKEFWQSLSSWCIYNKNTCWLTVTAYVWIHVWSNVPEASVLCSWLWFNCDVASWHEDDGRSCLRLFHERILWPCEPLHTDRHPTGLWVAVQVQFD